MKNASVVRWFTICFVVLLGLTGCGGGGGGSAGGAIGGAAAGISSAGAVSVVTAN